MFGIFRANIGHAKQGRDLMADQKTQNFLRKMKDRLLGGMVGLVGGQMLTFGLCMTCIKLRMNQGVNEERTPFRNGWFVDEDEDDDDDDDDDDDCFYLFILISRFPFTLAFSGAKNPSFSVALVGDSPLRLDDSKDLVGFFSGWGRWILLKIVGKLGEDIWQKNRRNSWSVNLCSNFAPSFPHVFFVPHSANGQPLNFWEFHI